MNKLFIIFLLGLFSVPCLAAPISTIPTPSKNTQSDVSDDSPEAKTWENSADGVHFALTQILPEQGGAFYVNRGFTLDQIKAYTTSCVFMTVLRNDHASGTIHFVSNNWAIESDGKSHQLTSVEQWLDRLITDNKPKPEKPALIAFRWAQFPPEQEYEPGGDWNQGMLSIGLPAGTEFNVTAKWDIEGKPYQVQLKGVQCAK